MAPPKKSLHDRFYSRVAKTARCWIWTGALNRGGYGEISIDGTSSNRETAHRASWILHKGQHPGELCVLHHCDNPACVRPSHLFLGTIADSNADMTVKNRNARGRSHGRITKPHRTARGVRHGNAKLDDGKVRRIRELRGSMSLHELARKFRVTIGTISFIAARQTWKHVI